MVDVLISFTVHLVFDKLVMTSTKIDIVQIQSD